MYLCMCKKFIRNFIMYNLNICYCVRRIISHAFDCYTVQYTRVRI